MIKKATLSAALAAAGILFAASSGTAADIRLKHTGKTPATDFHIVFSGPVAGLKKIKDTWDADYGRPDQGDPNALNFGGKWNMGEDAIFNIDHLTFARNPATPDQLTVVSWKFTPDSTSDPQPTPVLFYQPDPGRPGTYIPLSDLPGLGVHIVYSAPEPAAWILMISGFGLAGLALRRQRVVTA